MNLTNLGMPNTFVHHQKEKQSFSIAKTKTTTHRKEFRVEKMVTFNPLSANSDQHGVL